MENKSKEKELACIAGAYGPKESIPLIGDFIGPKLLDMVAIAYSKLGSPSGIFQNDGTVFPTEDRIGLLKKYCQEIRSTKEGLIQCRACDYQAVRKFTGGDKALVEPDLVKRVQQFPIEQINEFGSSKEGVYCYRCHAGLLELIRAITLDRGGGLPTPIGAIWAGQNKVDGYSLSYNEVAKLAEEIGYQKPQKLVRLYKGIKSVDARKMAVRAKNLAEIARPLEEMASTLFRTDKQARFNELSNAVLLSLRTSLSDDGTRGIENVQTQVYTSIRIVLREITDNVGNIYSALCEIPSDVDETKHSKSQVRVVAHAGVCKRKLDKTYHINVRQKELYKAFGELESNGDLKSSFLDNLDSEFFVKLKNTIQIEKIRHAIVARIPALKNKIVWVTFLFDSCDVLTPYGKPLPDFIRMMDNILQGMTQIINIAYLVAQQQETVRTLERQKKQLEEKDAQSRLLVENLAHQVSRPIMELKQSAYILSQGFSKDAYDGFRACLAELERGCRNFDVYEKLTTDFDKRGYGLHTSGTLDVKEVVEKAYERIQPYLRVERIEVLIKENVNKGYAIPKVVGNPEAILECLVNILHNAIKYSMGGYPVEVEISRKQGSSVDIHVTNLGIELRKEDWEKIFEEATRAETAKAVAIEGSGLGLYISQKLAALHECLIRVESCVPGKALEDGTPRWKTTFKISLKC